MRASAAATSPRLDHLEHLAVLEPDRRRRGPARPQLRDAEPDLAAQRRCRGALGGASRPRRPAPGGTRRRRRRPRSSRRRRAAPPGPRSPRAQPSSGARALEHGPHDQALQGDPDREQVEDLRGVRTGMCALRLGSRTSRPSWQSAWIAARTVGRATPNSAASSSSGRRTPGSISPSRIRARSEATTASVRRDRPHGEPGHQAATASGSGPGAGSGRRGPSTSARASGRGGAHAERARLLAPPAGGADVEHALGRDVEATAGPRRRPRTRRRTGTAHPGSPRGRRRRPAARTGRRGPRPRARHAAGAPWRPRGRATPRRSPRRDSRVRAPGARTHAPAHDHPPAPPRAGAGRRRDRAGSRHYSEPTRTPPPRLRLTSPTVCRGRRTRRPRSPPP